MAFLAVCIAGILSIWHLPIDAFPDISPNLVRVFAEVNATAPEEVERLVTRPIEQAMVSVPGVQRIRSLSSYGLSTVRVYFDDEVDIHLARQLVNEGLKVAEESVPQGLDIPHGLEMGAIASGMGKILCYSVEGKGLTSTELRALQDWVIKPGLEALPGVAEVLSQGGYVKEYQVKVSPKLLSKHQVTLTQVIEAVQKSNQNVGAGLLASQAEEWIIRSLGRIRSVSDIESIAIQGSTGTIVQVKDVATVELGGAERHGVASKNGEQEIVTGTVYKVPKANSFEVIATLKERLKEISAALPKGAKVVLFYDQGALVSKSVNTVRNAVGMGLVLVCLVSLVFLGRLRNSIVVVLSIPFAMLFAFILLYALDIPGDLISFGGLAVALGMLVDASIIMVEKLHANLQQSEEGRSVAELIVAAGQEVGRPIFFAIGSIIIVFLPIWSLGGVEGKMFRPLAISVSFAMIGALMYALVMAPVFYGIFRRPQTPSAAPAARASSLARIYRSGLEFLLLRRRLVAAVVVALIVCGGVVFNRLGKVFMPKLAEGTIQVVAYMDPNISLREIGELAAALEKELLTFPEVKFAVSDIGYGDVGPHVHHTNFVCLTASFHPRRTWKTAKTQSALVAKISEHLEGFPAIAISFSQPIEHEVEDLIAGAGADVVAKLFGHDIEALRERAAEVESVIAKIPGAADVRTEQVLGQTQLQIDIDRDALAEHGLHVADVQTFVQAALGGVRVGKAFEGDKVFDISVRFDEPFRKDVEAIEKLEVSAPGGKKVELAKLAKIGPTGGLRQISRENGRRYIKVVCNVRGRDAGGFVEEAQRKVGNIASAFPPEMTVSWGGQFRLQRAADRRLSVVIPLTLGLILFVLYIFLRSVKEVLLIALNIPLALVGGVFALALSGQDLSIPSSIGFIALFGIALQDGLVLVSRFKYLREEGLALEQAVVWGAISKLRPVLMTTVTTTLGLLPLVLATGPGSEIQKPLAIVVVGGLLSSILLALFAIPVLYAWQAQGPVEAASTPE